MDAYALDDLCGFLDKGAEPHARLSLVAVTWVGIRHCSCERRVGAAHVREAEEDVEASHAHRRERVGQSRRTPTRLRRAMYQCTCGYLYR
eukprot:6186644-Pleurochrysis_carterae.AAC.2